MNKLPFLTLVALAISAVPLRSQSEKKPFGTPLTAAEQQAELARLREIFTSVEKQPATKERWVEVQEGPAEKKTWHRGWLLHESTDEIRLLNENGQRVTFDRSKLAARRPAAEFKWLDVWAVRNADFAKYCRTSLEKMAVKKDNAIFDVYSFQLSKMEADNAVLDAARLASWASAAGYEGLAGQLLSRAIRKLQDRRSRFSGYPVSAQLHQFVAEHTAPQSQDNQFSRLDGTEISARELRVRALAWDKALAKIPYRPDHDAIVRRVKQLESLIAEDKDCKEPSKEAFAKMNVNQKAAYWLHQLRDLHVTQSSSPGFCCVLTDSSSFFHSQHLASKGTPNAAVELMKLGYEALPQIIAQLDDERPTRCVGFWRDFAPESYYTLAYGDCCLQIFEAIALHALSERPHDYPVRAGLGKQCKERAEKWWRESRQKGEKQMLIAGTGKGDRLSFLNAERLIQKFPTEAFEPIQAGINAAKEDWIRSNLVLQLRQVKDDRVTAMLLEEARGSQLSVRMRALEALLQRNAEEGVTLLVTEWMKLDLGKSDLFEPWESERILHALIRCGKDKAVAALVARWKQLPLDWRHDALDSLRTADKDFADQPFAPKVNDAVDAFLISCLSDREESRRRRRTCDLAANALALRWGDAELFDVHQPLATRNRKLVEIENVWRKKHGHQPLPVPDA